MKAFSILGGKAHVVELPEGATNLQVVTIHQGSKSFPSLKYDRPDLVRGYIDLPPGTWQIVGMLPEVTEEQASEIIDEPFVDNLVALQSAIEAAGFIFSTDECPNQFCENGKIDIGYGEFTNCKICDESRVLCRERCLVLRRTDG
jgi:hypothetical protein